MDFTFTRRSGADSSASQNNRRLIIAKAHQEQKNETLSLKHKPRRRSQVPPRVHSVPRSRSVTPGVTSPNRHTTSTNTLSNVHQQNSQINFNNSMFSPDTHAAWFRKLKTLNPNPFDASKESIAVRTYCETNNTVDPEVQTPTPSWNLNKLEGQLSFMDLTERLKLRNHDVEEIDRTPSSPPKNDIGHSAPDNSTFNLNSLPSQILAVPNSNTDYQLFPFDGTEILLKRSSPYTLSNDFQGRGKGANQSRCITNDFGTECQAYQTLLSQNRNIEFKNECDADINIIVEAPPSLCATSSVSNTTSEQDLPYSQRKTSSPSLTSISGSETCSWSSDNDTDWDDNESDDKPQTFATPVIIEGSSLLVEQELPNLVTTPMLSKMKQRLVDRIMVEFWQIFNQGNKSNIYDEIPQSTCLHQSQELDNIPQDEQNTSATPQSNVKFDIQVNRNPPTRDQNGKRRLQGQDDDENDEDENRTPKRPKSLLSPRNQNDTNKFACPYRKHDARKYCVRHWGSCALTPLGTVARVKGHLYRHHLIFPCPRCQTLFNNQHEVTDHLKQPEGCELFSVVHQDGITNEIVEKLRSKKKAHRNQSEEDRWKEIYQILFPGEMVPSPFFEEIQEDTIQSPDSRKLADYEEYCRLELPRVFRASLEEVVNNGTQPLEEQLRSQIMDLIRDAQDRVFVSYRSSSITRGTPVRGAPSPSPQIITSSSLPHGFSTSPLSGQSRIGSSNDISGAQLPPFFQPPSPQNHLESGWHVLDRNMSSSQPDPNDRSDSGYDSSSFALKSALPLTPGDSIFDPFTSSIQTSSLLEENPDITGHTGNTFALTQERLEIDAREATSGGNGHLNSELFQVENDFDFDPNSANLPNLMDDFSNFDFCQM